MLFWDNDLVEPDAICNEAPTVEAPVPLTILIFPAESTLLLPEEKSKEPDGVDSEDPVVRDMTPTPLDEDDMTTFPSFPLIKEMLPPFSNFPDPPTTENDPPDAPDPVDIVILPPSSVELCVEPPTIKISPALALDDGPEDKSKEPDAPIEVNPEPTTTSPLPNSVEADISTMEPLEAAELEPLKNSMLPPFDPCE
jgi:hypothetical protein